ncbi:MAG: hypothetical protein KDI09_21195, partial [Halioglobus sp.]|nr:hypothetical protein [Halioglobus sp.]
MSQAITPEAILTEPVDSKYRLSPEQVHYFDTFGYIKLPGLFREDIDAIVAGFEDLFGNAQQPVWETQEALHGDQRRVIIPGFIEQAPRLRYL